MLRGTSSQLAALNPGQDPESAKSRQFQAWQRDKRLTSKCLIASSQFGRTDEQAWQRSKPQDNIPPDDSLLPTRVT